MNAINSIEGGETVAVEDLFRRQALAQLKLKRHEALQPVLFHDVDYSQERLVKLEQLFMEAKTGKNMGEVMAMALKPPFLGVIRVAELGKTDTPGTKGEVDGLKRQYKDLLRWMKLNGWVDEELPRSPTARYMTISRPTEDFPDIRLIHRVRLLVASQQKIVTEVDDQEYQDLVDIKIAKRMVFGMDVEALTKACSDTGDVLYNLDYPAEPLVMNIEKYMDHKSPAILPVRTEYFLDAAIIKDASESS